MSMMYSGCYSSNFLCFCCVTGDGSVLILTSVPFVIIVISGNHTLLCETDVHANFHEHQLTGLKIEMGTHR